MVSSTSSFLDLYHHSVRNAWNLEALLVSDWKPDSTLPFMPDHVTHGEISGLLNPAQHLRLSQSRGCEYLAIIILIEDVIVDFFLEFIARDRYQQSFEMQQTLANFISEEMKHRLLFQHFLTQCVAAGNFQKPQGQREALFLRFVLKHSDLGILLFILHGEIMTYYNYAHSVRDTKVTLDPFFSEILRLHWMEESSHIRIDELLVQHWRKQSDGETIRKGIQDYFWLLDFLAGALRTAMTQDLEGLGLERDSKDAKTYSQLWRAEQRFYLETYILDVLRSKRLKNVLMSLDRDCEKELTEKVEQFEELCL